MSKSRFDLGAIRRDKSIVDVASGVGIKVKKNGKGEWLCLCPFHAEHTPSFTIYDGRKGHQLFYCYGCDARGDVIDFVQRYNGVEMAEACEILGGTREWTSEPPRQVEPVKDTYEGYTFKLPPEDAIPIANGAGFTPPIMNPKREEFTKFRPTMKFPYRTRDGRLICWVLRVEFDGRKITPAVLWMERPDGTEGWTLGSLPEPRPPYNLQELTERPDAPVIIVEGEKAADAAKRLYPKAVAISWLGGGKAYAKTMWSLLKGRRVMLWPDNDEPGENTCLGYWNHERWTHGLAELLIAAGVDVVKYLPRDPTKREGWDVADAEKEEQWTKDQAAEYLTRAFTLTRDTLNKRRARLDPEREEEPEPELEPEPEPVKTVPQAKPLRQEEPAEKPKPKAKPRKVAPNIVSLHGGPIAGGGRDWRMELSYTEDGKLRGGSTKNAILKLSYEDRYRGLFAWDDFASRVTVTREPPWRLTRGGPYPRAMADDDVISLKADIEAMGITQKKNDIGAALLVASKLHRYNPVTDYLGGLKWDGVPRLSGGATEEGDSVQCWLAEYAGAEPSPINAAFGRRWMISAVARAFEPGCKVDTMLILEGPQGLMKSSALRALAQIGGRNYHTDSIKDTSSKDAVQQMMGHWIVEFAELDAMNRADSEAFKGFMSRATDNVRLPYATAPEDFPRSCVFSGTVNPAGVGYLKDPTGARRFWPVKVTDIQLDRLAADRDQLWAEAVAAYRAGEQWWLTDEEEPLAREAQAARYQTDPWGPLIDNYARGKLYVTTHGIIEDALSIPRSQQTPMTDKRIAAHLVSKGYRRRLVAGDLAETASRILAWVKEPEE